MLKEHVINKLSAYCNGELSKDEARQVSEHLLACARCRQEYDDIKLGAQLAARLPEVAAPVSLWNDIEALLDAQTQPRLAENLEEKRHRRFAFFGWKQFAFAAAVFVVALGVAAVWYNSRLSKQVEEAKREIARIDPETDLTPLPLPIPDPPVLAPERAPERLRPVPVAPVRPDATQAEKRKKPSTQETPSVGGWEVARLEGSPKVGASELAGVGKIQVGEWLETDDDSRARITVGKIGHVEVAPNTRIRLLEAKENEHRLALAVGEMHAKIYAPPRIFFVNTPTAQAIDLGCEYTLEVDESGASVLRVQSGWVAFVSHGRESLVPEGALAITRKGFAPGTPYFADAPNRFKEALTKFDFARGGKPELDVMLREARARDTLTLWHLLSRVNKADRARLFERMVGYVPLPEDVTREGILRLDKEMLRLWKLDLEVEWYAARK